MIAVVGLGFILGAVLGSFIDCIASRSLTNESFRGRSYCDRCKKTLAWYDLIPIFSFIFSKGQCRYCSSKLSYEYPLVEILTGILIAFTFYQTIPFNFLDLSLASQIPIFLLAIFNTFIVCTLLIVFITDIKEGIIPDRITYPAVLIGIAYFLLTIAINSYFLYKSLDATLIGQYLLPPHSDYFLRHVLISAAPFIGGILSALGLGLFFLTLILVTKGRGMGGGDLKLGIFMGLALGFPNSLVALMIAFLSGSIVGIILLIIKNKRLGQTIPFGPFLSLGGIVALFYSDQILNWYINSFSTSYHF